MLQNCLWSSFPIKTLQVNIFGSAQIIIRKTYHLYIFHRINIYQQMNLQSITIYVYTNARINLATVSIEGSASMNIIEKHLFPLIFQIWKNSCKPNLWKGSFDPEMPLLNHHRYHLNTRNRSSYNQAFKLDNTSEEIGSQRMALDQKCSE